MAEKVAGIYYIQNNVNGKRYIGSSVDVYRRIKCHLNNLRKGVHVNVHLSRAWSNVGETLFETGICEFVSDVSKLIEREQHWIDTEGYYNIAPVAGSTLGFKQSDAFKAHRSALLTGAGNPMFGKKRPEIGAIMRAIHTGRKLTDEHKRKCSESLKGKAVGIPLSAETKAKIGAANKGRVLTPEHRAKLIKANKNRPPISKETREKLRAASSNFKHSSETKEKLSKLKLGVPRSSESIAKQRETIRKNKEVKLTQ